MIRPKFIQLLVSISFTQIYFTFQSNNAALSFQFGLVSSRSSRSAKFSTIRSMTNDPFEDFDPRLPPNSYSRPKRSSSNIDITSSFSAEKPPFGSASTSTPSTPPTSSSSDATTEQASTEIKAEEDPVDFFDPRISPHMYPNGIPTTKSSSSSDISTDSGVQSSSSSQNTPQKIGILLIDHGSRKKASNDLLHTIADLYQESSHCPPHFVVKAAHMELAAPSIQDAIHEMVLTDHIQQIICHPYFLSPGRHVTEDIPQLVEEAKQSIIEKTSHPIQIITTRHTGSGLNAMINAIANIVEESVKTDLMSNDTYEN